MTGPLCFKEFFNQISFEVLFSCPPCPHPIFRTPSILYLLISNPLR